MVRMFPRAHEPLCAMPVAAPMNAEAPLPSSRRLRLPVSVWSAVPAILSVSPVVAQTALSSRAADAPALLRVFERLGPLAIALTAAGALILLLLLVRIWSMIRRERPVIATAPRRRGKAGGDSLDRATISASTDWGFDQNKRAALSRTTVVVGKKSSDLASISSAATMWSTSDVQNAAAISMRANEGMGKSPNAAPSPYMTSHNPYFRGESQIMMPMEVVEVADTLLQAELLVQLGDPKQAMILLSQHIRDTEEPGPGVWLMLLNLYQTTGRKSQYEALAVGFKTLFNAAVPAWATSAESMARDLESYAQVMMKLQSGWPQPTMRPMLENLLNDDRGGSRQGFSLAAYRDILFLLELLNVLDQMTQEEIDRALIQRKLESAG